jgi:hypothetical protein
MKMNGLLGKIGKVLAALVVSALFFLCTLATYYSFGVGFFRFGFYLPALGIVLFLYFGKKKRGFFLESLAFVLALSLAVVTTLDLIVLV